MDPKPLFTRQVSAGTRVYYLDAFKDSKDQPYMVVSEIATDKSPKEIRSKIFIHSETMPMFADAFNDVAEFIRQQS